MSQASEWYQHVVNNIIDDDGKRQRVDIFELMKSVESNIESAQIVIQVMEQELKKNGLEEGVILRAVWIAAALMLSPHTTSETIKTLSKLAPSICEKAIRFIKDNDLM